MYNAIYIQESRSRGRKTKLLLLHTVYTLINVIVDSKLSFHQCKNHKSNQNPTNWTFKGYKDFSGRAPGTDKRTR